jgi:hypothetical protein
MGESPCEYWIGTIETAPYTQSSDSATKVRFFRGRVKAEASLAVEVPPHYSAAIATVPSAAISN